MRTEKQLRERAWSRMHPADRAMSKAILTAKLDYGWNNMTMLVLGAIKARDVAEARSPRFRARTKIAA